MSQREIIEIKRNSTSGTARNFEFHYTKGTGVTENIGGQFMVDCHTNSNVGDLHGCINTCGLYLDNWILLGIVGT